MAEQIFIEFIGDASRLTPAVDILEQMGAIDQKAAAAFRQTNTEFAKRADVLKKVTAEEQKQMKSLSDMEKQVNSLAESLIEGFKEGFADALAEAGVSLDDFLGALGNLDQKIKENTTSSDSLKKQLREMTQQLAVLEAQGKRNTEEYNELVRKAGELKDAIGDANEAIANAGSDTRRLDNLISITSALAGGFAVAQGAAALFGDESEELQKTLLKVNAAMAILQGLQQIQDTASKRQFASLGALLGLKRADVVATGSQAAATGIATAATRVWNAVLRVNPIFLMAGVIGGVVAALRIFSSNTDKAAERSKALNDTLLEQAQRMRELQNLFSTTYGTAIRQTEVALEKARASGASTREILALEKKLLEQRQMQAQDEFISTNGATRLQELKDELKGLQQQLNSFGSDLSESEEKQKAAIESKFNLVKFTYEQQKEIVTRYYETNLQLSAKELEIIRLRQEEALKSATAYAESRVLIARRGSREELNARIAAVQASLRQELDNVNITAGERAKAIAAANRQIADLRFDFEKKALEDAKRGIDAQVLQQKEGSKEQLDYRLESLRLAQEIELKNQELTENQKLEIEARYLKMRNDMIKEYDRRIAEEQISTRLSQINTRIADMQRASLSEANEEMLQLRRNAIDEQASLEELAARNSITNEEQLQARLLEIRANADAQKRALDERAKEFQIDTNLELQNAALENEKKQAQIILAGSGSSLAARIEARNRIRQLDRQQIDDELKALEDKRAQGLIAEEDYQKQLLEIKGKYLDLELQQVEEQNQRKAELLQAGLDVMRQVTEALFEGDSERLRQRLEQDLKMLETQKQKELDNVNLTEQQRADIEARYRERERQIRRRNAEEEKKAKINQAIVNGALAIVNIMATAPFFTWPIAIPLAAATTAIQVAKIQSTPIPQFKKGTRSAPKGYAWVGEEGPELVELAGGEKIYTYGDSMRVARAWEKGVPATADEILSGNIPSHVDQELISNTYVNAAGQLQVDYDRIGKSVARHMPKPVSVHTNLDKNGFSLYLIEESNKTQVLNQRYKMN